MAANEFHIFHLDKDPRECAKNHCDIHVASKIGEYARHLSTAHRLIDGVQWQGRNTHGQQVTRYFLKDPVLDRALYKATHINHPSAVWTRESYENYTWLYDMWLALSEEFTYRFDKIHSVYQKTHFLLLVPPENIKTKGFVQPFAVDDYRDNYWENRAKTQWTRRSIPEWWHERVRETGESSHGGKGEWTTSTTGGSDHL